VRNFLFTAWLISVDELADQELRVLVFEVHSHHRDEEISTVQALSLQMVLSDQLGLGLEPVEWHQLQLGRAVVNSGVV
jgi:hypothetical protein